MLLHGDHIEMSFFPKLWVFISFSNQVRFENSKALSYSLQKDLSYGLYHHTPIGPHFTPPFKGLEVKNQMANLTSTPSFYHLP
jgi:hypothetical protein